MYVSFVYNLTSMFEYTWIHLLDRYVNIYMHVWIEYTCWMDVWGEKIADGGVAVVGHANPRSDARGLCATSANCPAGGADWRTLWGWVKNTLGLNEKLWDWVKNTLGLTQPGWVKNTLRLSEKLFGAEKKTLWGCSFWFPEAVLHPGLLLKIDKTIFPRTHQSQKAWGVVKKRHLRWM